MKHKLFICGGHVTPALALIDTFQSGNPPDIVFIGRKHAAEHALITEKHIQFLPISAGKLHRSFSIKTLLSLLLMPVGFVQAVVYCMREHPSVIVSFGGYVALPVAIAGWVLGIPVITHEQTVSAGLANRIIGMIARRVCVTHEESLSHFPRGKAVLTGLPLRGDIFTPSKKAAYKVDETHYPIIYITGGSQGAKSLNEKIYPAISTLTKSYTVIHQTGSVSFKPATRYIVERYIPLHKLSWVLQHAMIIIGRSGANTTVELAALGKVAILVPLPWSAGNEQLLQAKWLAAHGGAEVIEQDRLTPEILIQHIRSIRTGYAAHVKRAEDFSRTIPRDGAERFADEIYALLSPHA